MLARSPMKRTRRKVKSAVHRAFHNRVASMVCLACGGYPVELHHVHSDGFKRIARDPKRVVPLCPSCHRTGRTAVHVIGHAVFNTLHGFDLLAEADRLWSEHV